MKHVVLNREFGIVRTAAVFGPGRGGTSLIAGCLRALGVCMGIAPHAYKHEWSPIVRQAASKIDLPRTYQNIQRMNASYPCWGWKFPSDVFHIEEITALLRNTGFIIVSRDLTEIALSSLARQDVPFEISLNEAAIVSQLIARRIRFWPWPILLVPRLCVNQTRWLKFCVHFCKSLREKANGNRQRVLSSRSRVVIGPSTRNRTSYTILAH